MTQYIEKDNHELTMVWYYWRSRKEYSFVYYDNTSDSFYQYSIPAEPGVITMRYQVLMPDGSLSDFQVVQWNQVLLPGI